MFSTPQLGLPLVMPAQAQKHVTVNEAFARLDAVAQMRVVSANVAAPPAAARDGESYIVPDGAVGAWAGREKRVAVFSNGGWVFVVPRIGWRAWDDSAGGPRMFDGTDWLLDAQAVAASGAATLWKVLEFQHQVVPGASNQTSVEVPAGSLVFAVTGRVVQALTGSGLGSWRLGVTGSLDRYGSGLGLMLNAFVHGITGTPVTYYTPTPLVITGEGGNLQGGGVRLCIHMMQFRLPRAVSS
jgi:hypothetical protein